MSIPDWATTVSGVLAALAAIWAAHRFITRSLIRDYLSELKPNGGNSMKDKIDDVSLRVNNLEKRIDQIYFLIVSEGKVNERIRSGRK